MRIFFPACVLLAALTACDSEGIDRNASNSGTNNSGTNNNVSNNTNLINSDSTNSSNNTETATETATETDSAGETGTSTNTTDTDTSDTNAPATNAPDTDTSTATGNENATENETDADATVGDTTDDNGSGVNMFGGSGSSDGGTSSSGPVNTFGGSGSSDGGNNTDNNNANTNEPTNNGNSPQNDGADATLATTAPSSGTTYVSTMDPIRSENGPLCLRPATDANGNVIMNERGNCPIVQFHGNLAFGDFLLATNAWNYCASSLPNWEQCISVDASSGSVKPRWDYDWGNEWDVNGQVWLVKSYPEIIYGIKSPNEFSGSSLAATPAETGLPARVNNLPYYKIDYSFSSDEYPTRGKDFNGQRINGERNIAVESFFHDLAGDCDINSLVRSGSVSNQKYEIMVWLDRGAERLPAAPNDYVTSQSLDGVMYDIYTKPSDREYIAFVAQNPTSSGQINWTTFIEWTRTYAHRVNEVFGRGSDTVVLQDNWCLANILLGTEIWWGQGYFQADEWTIHRTVR